MKKSFLFCLLAVSMLLLLAACNTNEDAGTAQRMNINRVDYGPGQNLDNGMVPGQNRFDVNIPFEGIQGEFENEGPFVYERADRNARQGDRLGTNKERVDEVSGSFREEVVRLTNAAREKNGLQPLKISGDVSHVAQKKAEDMARNQYFSHTSPKYGSPFDMLKAFGVEYRVAAENIAAGQQTPKQVVNGWLNSTGHRRNIMNENLTHIGVGFAEDGQYWTQMFIGKK